MRKENHLNTHFNLRKTKLREITKQNKQLFHRINSQKSLYSSIELNKSFEEANKVKNRLSQSKLSQRSASSRSHRGAHPPLSKKQQIDIKTASINQVLAKDLKTFKGLFSSTHQQAQHSKNVREIRSFSNNSSRNKE